MNHADHPDGKLIREASTAVTEDLHDALVAMAVISGKTKAEYIRNVLSDHVYGRLAMLQRWTIHDKNGTAGIGRE